MAQTMADLLRELRATVDRGGDVSPLTDAIERLIEVDPDGSRAALHADDGDPGYRLWAIGLLGDPRDFDLLTAALADPALRFTALEALANQPGADAVDALARTFLDDPDPRVRAMAVGLVAFRDGPGAGTALLPLAGDPDVGVRIAVAWRLSLLRDPATEPALRALQHDPDEMVRRFGTRGLDRLLSPPGARPALP